MEFNRGQRKIINGKPNGHLLIKGISGTGKTTAFVNKIPSLLNKYCISKDDRVLITASSEENIKKIAFIYENIEQEKYHQSSFFDTDNSDKLEMNLLTSLVTYYFNQYNNTHKKKFDVASYDEIENELKNAISVIRENYSKKKIKILNSEFFDFIKEEIIWIKACNYLKLEEYQNAYRPSRVSNCSGAPKSLRKNSKQRQAIHEVLVEYNNNLKKINKIDSQDIALLALKEAIKKPSKKYTHICIDNCQELTKVQLELLKAIYNEKNYSSLTFIFNTMAGNNPYGYIAKGRSFANLGYDMKGKSVTLSTIYTEEVNIEPEIIQLPAKEKAKTKAVKSNSAMNANTTLYIDLKRNISHRFFKDSGAEDDIYIEYDGTEEKAENVVSIPVFNEIAAGNPILMNDSVEDNYSLPKEWIRSTKDVFMLKVKGDSMINKNIYDGDYVVISKQNMPKVHDIVAVDIEGEATLKTYKVIDGKITLTPENEHYEPIIIEDQQFSFLGVAIGLVKNS
ncbi:transcriptional repressor LexA [Clostridium sp. C2-6-12]|uniref:transcriptional repressor LexA n=1 Tax=Clostridium sp. C2-6-12 TaxID=2698832 RepID=UPI00136C5DC2|nr:transcriptional repressor LexA [Clostridium sp. C2-6-12]